MLTRYGITKMIDPKGERTKPTNDDPSKFHVFGVVEDLTEKVEVAIFNKSYEKIMKEYGDVFKVENKVILSGKVQHRDENSTTLIVDSLKPVENTNLLTITLKDGIKYEQLFAVKDVLAQHHGGDPVIFKLPETNTTILTNSAFWVEANNELFNKLESQFKDILSVNLKSMDTEEAEQDEQKSHDTETITV